MVSVPSADVEGQTRCPIVIITIKSTQCIGKKMTTKFEKDHPYMIRLDEALMHYYVVKVDNPEGVHPSFHHGEDFEEMKQVILDSLFTNRK